MKLKEAFAKKTYRERRYELHYSIALFKHGKYSSLVYDEYDRVPTFGFKEGADRWLNSHAGFDLEEGWEWRVIKVDIVPSKV